MGRAPCCDDKVGRLKKGAWAAEEDEKLVSFMQRNNGHRSWQTLPQLAGLQRCGKSCRLRWTNYLRPNIKRGNFSPEEERLITQLHALVGNKWSNIASHLPGRTDNEVKNHWNTHLKKRLSKMGIDPATHLPITKYEQSCCNPANYNNNCRSGVIRPNLNPSIISHMTQWELARMEAEARFAARQREHANYISSSGSITLLDYLIMGQNCTPRVEISVPQMAAHSSYMTLQNCEDALRMQNQTPTPLSTIVTINGTDHRDLDLDYMIALLPSALSRHNPFQYFQGGELAHPLEPSAQGP